MKIAVDAMGGDRAPEEILRGVALALESGHVQADEVILVGLPDRLKPYLDECSPLAALELVPASQVVTMADSTATSLRGKPDSSIQVALRLVKEGVASAFISAGNTGAVVACAWSLLRRLPGVRRPGIAVTFQSVKGHTTILDVGANVHCKPLHLFQYGVMADVLSRDVLGVESPRIGLLNIGEEEKKGNELVRETREFFERSSLNFVGNVEGNGLWSGHCDVIVCEGFVGNVVLKVSEGIGGFLRAAVRQELSHAASANSPLASALQSVTSRLDYAEYGGAPLLGVNGLVMIMHGRSDRRAMSNALRVSRRFVKSRVNEHISNALTSSVPRDKSVGDVS